MVMVGGWRDTDTVVMVGEGTVMMVGGWRGTGLMVGGVQWKCRWCLDFW